MAANPVLKEIRETRERLLEESGGTLDGLVARLQAEEAKLDRSKFITPRSDRDVETETSGEDSTKGET